MARSIDNLNVMLAPSEIGSWATNLASSLTAMPVDLHWSRTDSEAIALAVAGAMHVAVMDTELPPTGGLDVLRRIRQLNIHLPCLLVCDEPDERVLQEALELEAFSVLQASHSREMMASVIHTLIRQVYRVDWPSEGWVN